jgi:cellulose synthase/poly-beta-1,6-N-acetylglucosamine synthase-like glycosyltransferase
VEARVPRRALPGFQVVEYLRAFLFGRMGPNRLGGNIVISGAFGLFRRDAVVRAGGYAFGSMGEDLELVLRMRREGYERKEPHKVVFVPDPVAWTEAPSTFRVLGRQRDRWHRGLAESLFLHRKVVLNPRYRALGMVVTPYFLFIELLAPVVEALGLVLLALGLFVGAVDWTFGALFLLFAYGYGLFLTAMTIALEEVTFRRYTAMRDKLLLVLWVVLENLGYRQLTVYWRLRGLVKFLAGKRDWGVMERKGFGATPTTVDTGRFETTSPMVK